jgi:hypothetical protein
MLTDGETAVAHANKQIDSSYACLSMKRQQWRMLTVGDTVVMHASDGETAVAHAKKQIDSSYACLLIKRQQWRMLTVGDTVVMHVAWSRK